MEWQNRIHIGEKNEVQNPSKIHRPGRADNGIIQDLRASSF